VPLGEVGSSNLSHFYGNLLKAQGWNKETTFHCPLFYVFQTIVYFTCLLPVYAVFFVCGFLLTMITPLEGIDSLNSESFAQCSPLLLSVISSLHFSSLCLHMKVSVVTL
jgi:hypothetical protein